MISDHDIIEHPKHGYKHLSSLPSENATNEFYKEKYYQENRPNYITYQKQDEWKEILYNYTYETLENTLKRKGRILDVGSGPGYFLLFGKNRGWDGVGIEPSVEAYEHSVNELGLDVLNETFSSEVSSQIGLFDVVYLNNVLEHVRDPEEILVNARKALKEEGLIYVCCPNDFNAFQEIVVTHLGVKPWFVVPQEHYNYFSFESLSKLLENTGYEVIHKEGSFPLELFLLMGDNYVNEPELGKKCHKKRVQFELNMIKSGNRELLQQFYQKISEIGLGREIVLIATK